MHFLTPALLDYVRQRRTSGGRRQRRSGRWRRTASTRAPATTTGWRSPAATTPTGGRSPRCIDRPDLADLTTAERLARRDELDAHRRRAGPATRRRPPRPALVIAAGVPAHAVQNSGECYADPQLRHAGHFVTLPHAEHGTIVVEGCRIGLSETPADVSGTPPFLGQDTVEMLTGDLGYDDERLGELFAVGAARLTRPRQIARGWRGTSRSGPSSTCRARRARGPRRSARA